MWKEAFVGDGKREIVVRTQNKRRTEKIHERNYLQWKEEEKNTNLMGSNKPAIKRRVCLRQREKNGDTENEREGSTVNVNYFEAEDSQGEGTRGKSLKI